MKFKTFKKIVKSLDKKEFQNKAVMVRINGNSSFVMKEIEGTGYSGVLGICIEINGI